MTDKPKIDLVLADLEKEIQEPEPFTVALPGGKRITFNDPFDFNLDERKRVQELMVGVEQGTVDDLDFLAEIMSEEDLKTYEDSNPKIRVHNTLMQRVMAYFQGALGESTGSDNS